MTLSYCQGLIGCHDATPLTVAILCSPLLLWFLESVERDKMVEPTHLFALLTALIPQCCRPHSTSHCSPPWTLYCIQLHLSFLYTHAPHFFSSLIECHRAQEEIAVFGKEGILTQLCWCLKWNCLLVSLVRNASSILRLFLSVQLSVICVSSTTDGSTSRPCTQDTVDSKGITTMLCWLDCHCVPVGYCKNK